MTFNLFSSWTGSLGWIKGRFFDDADHNNSEWNDETHSWDAGIAGATISLLDSNGDVVATTTTDAHGNYQFDVAPGDYRVLFPDVEGKEFSVKDAADYRYDSDADANGLTDWFHVLLRPV